MIEAKPTSPIPIKVRRALRRILPFAIYRRYFGRHDDATRSLWSQLAEAAPKDRVILDIGAYHGEFAEAARDKNPTAPIYAFEPNPDSFKILSKRCEGKKIEPIMAAVAGKSGVAPFSCNQAISAIKAPSQAGAETPDDASLVEVNTIGLDDWTEAHDLSVSLIKIDTEGAEAAILAAGRRTLEQQEPIILVEVLTDARGEELMRVLPSTYEYWHIDENGSPTLRPSITRKHWRNMNWILKPRSRHVGFLPTALP